MRFHISNPDTIYNINHFLNIHNCDGCTYVEGDYINSKSILTFRCKCGNLFQTSFTNVRFSHKTKCNKCSGYNNNLPYDEVFHNLQNHGYILLVKKENFFGICKTKLICTDVQGYKYVVTYDAIMRNKNSYMVHKSNPYSIYNINRFLKLKHLPFTCLSKQYINKKTQLEFICDRCGKHIFKSWSNIYRNDNPSRHYIMCDNCDGRLESIHALVLKQIFQHVYPDTIVEEKSCINPITNKIMPTDIVNHRLKIAIEIQSEFHDNEYSKVKDKIKKDFWLNKGYSFYDPDIRNYSILEICQLFFDIEQLPNYINYNYSNKINIFETQKYLNKGMKIPDIAKEMNINVHRIYDAIYDNKLIIHKNHVRADKRPLVQLNEKGEYVNEYSTIVDAAKNNGINNGTLVSALNNNRQYVKGFYWIDKSDYYSKNYSLHK